MRNAARILRLCLGTVIVFAAVLTGGPAAEAATVLNVGNSSATAFNFMPLALGIKEGYFRQNGVDVQVIDLAGAGKVYQAMVAGSIDLALGAGTDVPFIMKGVPETGVGAIAITPALLGIVVPYNSPIHSLADLKGKRVGVSTVGSLTEWVAFEAIHKAGLTQNDITIVTDGSTTAPQVAALETGQVDAQVGGVAMGWNLEQQKKGRLLAPASEFVGPFLLNVIYASNAIIKDHPDAVRGFLKGWYETVNFMAAHRAETVAFEKSIDNLSDAVDAKQYDALMPSMSRDGRFPPDAVAAVARSLVELHLMETEPDMSKFLTTRFLPGQE